MKNIYPDIKNLFADTRARRKTGRPLCYEPDELECQFEAYIADLMAHPIEVETQYKRQSKKEGAFKDREERQQQNRVEHLPRAPRVSDFVVRWLGKDMSWWGNLSRKEYHPETWEEYLYIKNKVNIFCYNAKLDGACANLYNPTIISREIGLTEKQQVEQKTTQVVIKVNNEEEANGLKELAELT